MHPLGSLRWVAVVAALLGGVGTESTARAACVGDCSGDTTVTVDELLVAVTIAQGTATLDTCPEADADGDGSIFIDDILVAVANALEGCAPSATATRTPPPTVTPTPTPTLSAPPAIPTQSAALRAWLEAGFYKTWTAESGPHPSGGPHGTLVRTFVNDVALGSLAAGNVTHPAGTALVKELYFSTNTSTPSLWAVAVKTRDDSGNGQNWYWWEGGIAGFGNQSCVPCHRGDFGNPSRDFVLTPYPLQ